MFYLLAPCLTFQFLWLRGLSKDKQCAAFKLLVSSYSFMTWFAIFDHCSDLVPSIKAVF